MDVASWERRDNESNLWFDRFDRFRLLGVRRSKLALYRAERLESAKAKAAKDGKPFDEAKYKAPKSVPKSWDEAAKIGDWQSRAEAWDKAEIQRRQEEYEAERLRQRERRQRVLDDAFDLVEKHLAKINFGDDITPSQFASLLNALYSNSRAEWDDEPAQRIEMESNQPVSVTFVVQPVPARQFDDDGNIIGEEPSLTPAADE